MTHRSKLDQPVSTEIIASSLGLLLNLTTDTSQYLREFGATICDNCLALIRHALCQKSLIVRGLGLIGHILPHSIPAVDLICEKGGTLLFLQYIKVSKTNPDHFLASSFLKSGQPDLFMLVLCHMFSLSATILLVLT